MNATLFRHGLNLWPPFLATGIHVTDLAADWRHARVELRLRPWNRNAVGTHFGGSLFAMTDPFLPILTDRQLGPGYACWDSHAEIDFVRPGRTAVTARIEVPATVVEEIRQATAGGDKHLRWFEIDLTDEEGQVVARLRRQLYVRRLREG